MPKNESTVPFWKPTILTEFFPVEGRIVAVTLLDLVAGAAVASPDTSVRTRHMSGVRINMTLRWGDMTSLGRVFSVSLSGPIYMLCVRARSSPVSRRLTDDLAHQVLQESSPHGPTILLRMVTGAMGPNLRGDHGSGAARYSY